ncbi:receptor-like protein 15 [Cynara cardunculus var. scolymus]|uniref:receptor-like protein 15 n=1 Tax=Cynara cardunculus var. scolymus TaxID=59895 RepID=UPI000D62D8B9|nr:receptor-like protein 15 [Cynara cardunculus var. scolymus]
MTILLLMVCQIEGGCIEEERKALLEIKTSLIDSNFLDLNGFLPSWVDDGSSGGECCDWERVTCNPTTGHVTNLTLRNMVGLPKQFYRDCKRTNWPLNVSVFLHFKELTSLNLSMNCLDNNIVKTGLGRLSSLKKLETLDLSYNSITNVTFPSLGSLTSLRVLHLDNNDLEGYLPALDFQQISALENLEILDLSHNYMEGFEQVSLLKKLKILNLRGNNFNESLITSLSALPILKSLDLVGNEGLYGTSFPVEELAHLTNLEELDLNHNMFNDTPSIQECTRLSRLKKLKSISLRWNYFNKSIISCLSALSSLKTLDLSYGISSGGSFPIKGMFYTTKFYFYYCLLISLLNDLLHLSDLEILLLSGNHFNGTLPMEVFTSFHHLEVLDLGWNNFVGSIPSTINALSPSIRTVSFAYNKLNGSILGLCELKNLRELDLSHNMFEGNLHHCFNSLSSLKLLDISSNQFTGTLPPSLIANLTSLEYVDFSDNKFEGAFSFSSLTLDIGNNSLSGRIPGFLGHLSELRILILKENNFSGSIPKQLCQLSNVSLIDLSGNSIFGRIPSCLQNIISPINPVFRELRIFRYGISFWHYQSVLFTEYASELRSEILEMQDEVQFTTKTQSLSYKGHILDLMVGLDLSRNKLVGEIPKELGLLTQIHSLNLSHNQLTGTIPMQFSNLENIESLDLSYNGLSGKVPSELSKLHYLAYFNVSYNNLSGRLPDMKAQFSTFTNESYEGNPLLCGPPLEKECTSTSQVTDPSGKEGLDKWYEINMVSFYGSCGATWVVFLLGFVGVLYINPYWRRRWLDLVEECMYTCYYFIDDSARKLSTLFRR